MTAASTSTKMGVLVGALVLVLAAGWFAVISPKRSEAARLQRQIEDTQGEIVVARTRSAQHAPQIRVADLFELSRAMPNRSDIPSVLLQLSGIAAETGVTFKSITPHEPVPAGGYERLAIDLVFEGHFYDLSDFLYRLRGLVGVHGGVLDATGRLFSVDAISFGQGDQQFPSVKATMTVSAYVFGDGTAAPVPDGVLPTEPTTTTAPRAEDSQPIPAVPPGASDAGA